MNTIWKRLFPSLMKTLQPDEQKACDAYIQMRECLERETPEQRTRFYLEVAALLGNESAAKKLEELGPDPETQH